MSSYDISFNVTSDLGDPEPWQNEPSAIFGITFSVWGLSALCVILRLYIRLRVVRNPGWDDVFVCLYLITISASSVAVCFGPSVGLGEHFIFLTQDQIRAFLLMFYVANATYMSSTAFIKLSLLFQYLRLYERGTAIWIFCAILAGAVALWGAAFSFLAWVPCLPVHKYWDVETPGGVCYGFGISTSRTLFIFHTTLNMVFDFLVLAMPVPLFFERGALRRRSRAAVAALLGLGGAVNVFAAWRLVLLIQAQSDPEMIYDATWFAPEAMLLATLEAGLASVCASVPVFWPVLTQHLGKIFMTTEFEVFHEPRTAPRRRFDELPGSETDVASVRGGSGGGHYHDSFVMDQVDPLRAGAQVRVETRVESEGTKGKKPKVEIFELPGDSAEVPQGRRSWLRWRL